MSLPRIYVHGKLTRDLELKQDQGGKLYCPLRVQTSDRRRNGQGTGWIDGPPTYINAIIFGKSAQNVVDSVGNGDMVQLWGRLQQRDYKNEETGQMVTTYTVIVEDFGVSTLFTTAPTRRRRDEPEDKPVASWQE